MSIPIFDLSRADDSVTRPKLLAQLHDTLFNVGFLYIKNHGVPQSTISNLTTMLPPLFNITSESKNALSKLNSPHFLGYNGFAEETTLGQKDLREQFDFSTELPVTWDENTGQGEGEGEGEDERDFSRPFWRLRGPNQWPKEDELPGFKEAFLEYHDALSELSRRFVHLVEEAFKIPVGTFDNFFSPHSTLEIGNNTVKKSFLPPQHRIKLLKYPATGSVDGQGVGPHKDSSGWLTFLYQVGNEPGLEIFNRDKTWIPAPPINGTFVVNFGNAFEAATEGAVKATVHRVIAPTNGKDRYSIPFFMGLPLDIKVSEIRHFFPETVRVMRKQEESEEKDFVSAFLDPRWDSLGESQLRKWIRSHEDVGRKWYGDETVDYYLS